MDDSKGGPFFADPRQVLRHAMKPLQEMGLTAVCATELEFYLLEPGAEVPTPQRRPDSRHAQGPVRPAVRQHGRRRGRRSLPRRPVRDLQGAEHPGRRDAQGVLARPVRDQPAPRRERRARRRPRRAAEARGEGRRAQARHGGELHGQALRGMGRLQHARAHQPGGRRRQEHLRRHEQGRPVRGHAAPRDRRAREGDAGIHGDLRADRELVPPLPAGRVRARSRRTGDAITAAWRCASRCPASRTRASSTAPAGPTAIPIS